MGIAIWKGSGLVQREDEQQESDGDTPVDINAHSQ